MLRFNVTFVRCREAALHVVRRGQVYGHDREMFAWPADSRWPQNTGCCASREKSTTNTASSALGKVVVYFTGPLHPTQMKKFDSN